MHVPRKDSLAGLVLSALAKLKVGRDAVLALAASCALLALTQEDADPRYIASKAAMVLADQVLQVRASAWVCLQVSCCIRCVCVHMIA